MSRFDTVEWDKLSRHLKADWKMGEHVGVVGPTGVGKTTLISRIVPIRNYCVVFVTKVHDKTISNDFPGFQRLEAWPPKKAWDRKILLWPRPGKTIRDTIKIQHDVFKDAMDSIFLEQNWSCIFDEQHYICQSLKLERENMMFQHQGRSSGISVVNGSQRPAWVPLVTFSGSTHMFLWKNTHPDDIKRLSAIGGIDRRDLVENLTNLPKHEFVYINTRTGTSVRSQVKR